MNSSQRGDIALFAEVIIVIVLIFGFLVAVKVSSDPKEKKIAAEDVYPKTSSVSENVAPRAAAPKKLPSSVIPATDPKVPQDEIVYTDTGFEPDILDIKNMNRVIIFRNKSSRSMWIASDPHPRHTDLISLNQGRSVAPGGVYWFAFSAGVGVYGYHNEINPGHHGLIIAR